MIDNPLIPLHQYRYVIFDVDGTLVNSNEGHAHSFMDAFEANGLSHLQFNDIRKLIGMSSMTILQHVLDPATFQEKAGRIEADHLRFFRERYLSQVRPIPGVLPLFEFLKAQGIEIALSSASPRDVVDAFIELLGVKNLIAGATSGEDVPDGKPNPLAIEACCQQFGFDPHQTLYVGDSPYDVIAAHEYSMPVIGVLTGGYSPEELIKTGAASVYEDLADIYQHYAEVIPSP